MKVLFIDPQSYNNLSVYDGSLLQSLAEDCEVVFLCSSLYDGPDLKDVEILPIYSYNNKHGIRKGFSYFISVIRLVRYAFMYKPDLIHIQWLIVPFLDIIVFRFVRSFTHSRVVFTAHNIVPHDSGNKYKSIFRRFYNWVDAIIVHDEKTNKELVSLFKVKEEKVSVIHHGLLRYRIDKGKEAREEVDLVERYRITPEELVFSVVGIQSKYKGTDVLLKTWALNKELRDNDSVKLVVAGRCSDLDYGDYLNIPNLIIEDEYISTERLVAILKLSSVVLIPYRKISQSGVLLSAIELEKPFLVTNVGGLAEPLRYGNVGWCVDACTENNLATVLLSIIREPMIVKEKEENKNAWLAIKRAYSWTRIGEKTSELYRTLLMDD